ncbi:MAG: nucleotide sugar dehydrogenase [Acidobacteria bacterium]|nr:nucleotide sugar dehydrogenase [Acidobacteriota bacterium]
MVGVSGAGERIAVIGLGYVGLPVAIAVARHFPDTLGFDISASRIAGLEAGTDLTGEVGDDELRSSALSYSQNVGDLSGTTFFIVTVPTPIDAENRPDLTPIRRACETIGPHLREGALVVFESTVYPGVTEDFCAPLLEQHSGLKRGSDFKLGYSPERINPGDKVHRLETITKIVSAEDAESLERVKAVYGSFVKAGLHVAPTIKVAEAAKVIENTQRDVNIALMNELSIIFDRMGISTADVLDAAGTKWNFLPFSPGLVGGHCIGVDPYYLTSAAERLGYQPHVILSGRRVNDSMAEFVAIKLAKLLAASGRSIRDARVGIMGVTFKEDVPDIRNSKVPDVVFALREFDIQPIIHDPLAVSDEVRHEYGLKLSPIEDLTNLDALIVAVGHDQYRQMGAELYDRVRAGGHMVDLKNILRDGQIPEHVSYWSL